MKIRISFLATLFLTVCALSLASAAKVSVELKDAQGKSVGSALMYQGKEGMVIQLNLHDLPPGEHAIHPISSRPARISIPIIKSTDWRIPKATTPATCKISPLTHKARRRQRS